MRPKVMTGLSALLSSLILTACGTVSLDRLIPSRQFVVPSIESSMFECLPEVLVGDIHGEVQFGMYAEAQRLAGADCRGKLHDVGETYNTLKKEAEKKPPN